MEERDKQEVHGNVVRSGGHSGLWWLLFPVRLLLEIVVTLFDLLISRYLVAAVAVGTVWLPLHYAFGLSFKYWLWPTLALGLALCGLWEGCNIFVVRPYFGKWVLVPCDKE